MASTMIKTNGDYTLVNSETQRGHIYRGTCVEAFDELVVRSFDHPQEVTPTELAELTNSQLEGLVIYERYEGTVVRAAHDTKTGKTIISTHGNIDAHKHSWGSRSFGRVFDGYIAKQISVNLTQEPYCNYVFIILLQDPENKMVCQVPLGGLHLATLDEKMQRIDVDIGLPRPTRVNVTDVAHLQQMMESADPMRIMGYVAMYDDASSLQTFNLTLPQWTELARVRGNNPHLVQRFLDVDDETRQQFVTLFPEYADLWRENEGRRLDQRIETTVDYLVGLFVRRHIRREFLPVQRHIHRFMQALMEWRNRQFGLIEAEKRKPIAERRHIMTHVTYDLVLRKLLSIPPCEIRRIIESIESGDVFTSNERADA